MKTCKKLLAITIALALLVTTLVSGLVVSAAEPYSVTIANTELTAGEDATVNVTVDFNGDAISALHMLATVTTELKIDDAAIVSVDYADNYVDPGDSELEVPALRIKNDGKNLEAGKILFESGVDGAVKATKVVFALTFKAVAEGTYPIAINVESTDYNEANFDAMNATGEIVVKAAHTCSATVPVDNGDGTHDVKCECGAVLVDNEAHNFVDGICGVCGAEEPVSGPVVDETITFRDINVSIGACLEMRFRVTKSTISSKYASVDFVVIPTKYDTTASNAFNEVVLDPIVLANEPTSNYNVYWYKDVAMYELGLGMDAYVRCYDAAGNMVATSTVQHIVPAQSLITTYGSTTNAKLKTAIADLLNMGTYAQVYFGNNNTNSDLKATVDAGEFVNIGIDQADASTSYGELGEVNTTTWGENNPLDATVYRMSVSLVASKAPSIAYRIYKGTQLDKDKMELNITYTSNSGTVTNYTVNGNDMYAVGSSLYYDCADLAYYDSNVTVTTTFKYDGAEVWTNVYSVESGVKSNLTSSNQNLVNLMEAIAKFGAAARTYTGYGA